MILSVLALALVSLPASQTLQQEILPSNPSRFAAFGNAVGLDGDVALIGSRDKTVNGLNYAGSAYVFRKVNGTWTEEAWLTTPSPEIHDELGYDVALKGDVALVGAPDFPVSAFSGTGRAWVYRRVQGNWTLEQELVPSSAYWDSATGRVVALDTNTAVVVTPMGWSIDARVTVFEYQSGVWTETARILPPVAFNGFGQQVSLVQGTLVISDASAVHVYEKQAGVWQRTATLTPPPNLDSRGFGSAVAFDGTRILAGAPNASIDGFALSGRCFFFLRNAGTWSLEQVVDTPHIGSTFSFGARPDIDGSIAVVSSSEGAQVLRNDGREWVVEPGFQPASLPPLGFFPTSVAVSGSQALFGAAGSFTPGLDSDGGAYVYTLDQPFHLRLLNGPLVANDQFRFDVHGATPNAPVWLAVSTTGLGSTFVPPLQATLDLNLPRPVASWVTDAAGYGSSQVSVPANTTGLQVWLQAVEFGAATRNLLAETIQ